MKKKVATPSVIATLRKLGKLPQIINIPEYPYSKKRTSADVRPPWVRDYPDFSMYDDAYIVQNKETKTVWKIFVRGIIDDGNACKRSRTHLHFVNFPAWKDIEKDGKYIIFGMDAVPMKQEYIDDHVLMLPTDQFIKFFDEEGIENYWPRNVYTTDTSSEDERAFELEREKKLHEYWEPWNLTYENCGQYF